MLDPIRVPANDIQEIGEVIRRIREKRTEPDLYVVVSAGQLELREGSNVTYGVRHFTPAVPS